MKSQLLHGTKRVEIRLNDGKRKNNKILKKLKESLYTLNKIYPTKTKGFLFYRC